ATEVAPSSRVRQTRKTESRSAFSGIFTEHAKDFALNADVGSRSVNRCHLGVGWLEADHRPLAVEAFERGIGAIDKSNDDFPLPRSTGALDKNVVAGDDVFVAHGVAADLKSEDFAVADDVVERDALRRLNGLDGLTGGDAAHKRKAVGTLFAGAHRENVDGAAAIMSALQKPFVLQIRDVLMHRGKRTQAE